MSYIYLYWFQISVIQNILLHCFVMVRINMFIMGVLWYYRYTAMQIWSLFSFFSEAFIFKNKNRLKPVVDKKEICSLYLLYAVFTELLGKSFAFEKKASTTNCKWEKHGWNIYKVKSSPKGKLKEFCVVMYFFWRRTILKRPQVLLQNINLAIVVGKSQWVANDMPYNEYR